MPKKLTYEQIKSFIENQGYILLSKEYIGSLSKLKLKCPKNHNFMMRWSDFKSGRRCPDCIKIKRGLNQRLTDEKILNLVNNKGDKLIDVHYIPKRTRLLLECQEGHQYEMQWSNYQQGLSCPICKEIKYKNSLYQRAKIYIEKNGYEILNTEYKNKETKLILKCPENHIFYMSFSSFHGGSRCPNCNKSKMYSISEKEILKYVKDIYNGKIKPNDRNTIVNPSTGRNLELDVYLPEINKAIEFNGTYWHSKIEAKYRDKIKKEQCKNLNIDLLIIKDTYWNKNKEKCLSDIHNFIYPQKKSYDHLVLNL